MILTFLLVIIDFMTVVPSCLLLKKRKRKKPRFEILVCANVLWNITWDGWEAMVQKVVLTFQGINSGMLVYTQHRGGRKVKGNHIIKYPSQIGKRVNLTKEGNKPLRPSPNLRAYILGSTLSLLTSML